MLVCINNEVWIWVYNEINKNKKVKNLNDQVSILQSKNWEVHNLRGYYVCHFHIQNKTEFSTTVKINCDPFTIITSSVNPNRLFRCLVISIDINLDILRSIIPHQCSVWNTYKLQIKKIWNSISITDMLSITNNIYSTITENKTHHILCQYKLSNKKNRNNIYKTYMFPVCCDISLTQIISNESNSE